jgi:anti-sigma factor RsiW
MSRRSADVCLTERELEDFLFDRLSGVTREVVEEHLMACHKCLDRVEKEEEFIRRFRGAARQVEIEDLESSMGGRNPGRKKHRTRWWATWGRWAGAAAVATGLVAVLILAPSFWQGSGKVVEIALRTERGPDTSPQAGAPSGRSLRLTMDVAALDGRSGFEAQLVDAEGSVLESAKLFPLAGRLTWDLRGRGAGQYWVRLYASGSRQFLREYSLPIR